MIKALVIDDKDFVRNDVREKLEQFYPAEISLIGEAENVAQGIDLIEELEPDLLFLDIQLPDGTGFDLIDKCHSRNFDVIFVTGFDSHAVKAFKVGALDYLLKPIDEEEFKNAVSKAISSNTKEEHFKKLIQVSMDYFNKVEKKRIVLKTSNTVYVVEEDDIIYCKSDGSYTTFYVQESEKIIISKPIKAMEELLSEGTFIRCHHSYIVNKNYVSRYNKKGTLSLKQKIEVPVSARRKDLTLKLIFK
ncbi:LytTR family DNA-binding domain-containing protein [Aureisphaera galaxeae]|uniref:LytR/AlgR family response regulator transcription factor n=1 Tax=Aureisphaera galaxeae TaxID=1538023 RepID=UPI00235073BA|nr:LytTR family DNA-binding domain-containing protein [Aureisphaera galaxeae]MDC8002499.1 LytTR family DNA-binding domain-containing protein [Aureisphaera galaxeae]